jgi:hypothetical protein
MIPLYCTSCGKELCVRDELLGNLVRCPICDAVFTARLGMEPPPTPYSLAIEPPPIRSGDPRPEVQAYYPETKPISGPWPRRRSRSSRSDGMAANRGALILALGIAGLVGSGCVLPGWILGNFATRMGTEDINRMDRGQMDASGRSMTTAGRICGIIAVVLSTLSSLAGIFVLVTYLIHVL